MFQVPRQREIWEERRGELRRREGQEDLGGMMIPRAHNEPLNNVRIGPAAKLVTIYVIFYKEILDALWVPGRERLGLVPLALAMSGRWGVIGGGDGGAPMLFVDFWFSACGILWFIDFVRGLLHWRTGKVKVQWLAMQKRKGGCRNCLCWFCFAIKMVQVLFSFSSGPHNNDDTTGTKPVKNHL